MNETDGMMPESTPGEEGQEMDMNDPNMQAQLEEE